MILLQPRMPAGSRVVWNCLYEPAALESLTDSLYLVVLPNGISIDVGWYPELDPTGAYEICVYRGEFENQLVPPMEVRDTKELIDLLVRTARDFQTVNKTSASGETIIDRAAFLQNRGSSASSYSFTKPHAA